MPNYLNMTINQVMNLPLTELKMSTRLRNCLESQGWTHVWRIAYRPRSEFHGIRNLGAASMMELEKLLKSLQVGVGLLYHSAENRKLWNRMRKQAWLKNVKEDTLFHIFCDLVQPRHT